MTDIRITIETVDAKYSDRFDLTGDDEQIFEIKETVAATLLDVVEPRRKGLTKQVETPGFVDTELSEKEYQLVVSYRTALAQVGGDEKGWNPVVSVLPDGARPETFADTVAKFATQPAPDFF